MITIGQKIKLGEQEVEVINILNRGFTSGWFANELTVHFKNPLYIIKRKSKTGHSIVTVKEAVLLGKERWSELDKVREK